MHPKRDILQRFVAGQLDQAEIQAVKEHIAKCEFCSEFVEEYSALADSLQHHEYNNLPEAAMLQANRIYAQMTRGLIIDMRPFEHENMELPLAAEGQETAQPQTTSRTLYSADPELVLRLVDDSAKKSSFLQLIGEDQSMVSGVLIMLPEQNLEFITDDDGRAEIKDNQVSILDDLKWQIKLPDAVFELKPIESAPDTDQAPLQTVFDSGTGDRLEVSFNVKPEGTEITLRLLELDGSTDIESVCALIRLDSGDSVTRTIDNGPIVLNLEGSSQAIGVRFFKR